VIDVFDSHIPAAQLELSGEKGKESSSSETSITKSRVKKKEFFRD
jgi:hypothetical protein